jgi:exodeoxyribonuclease VII small subunit
MSVKSEDTAAKTKRAAKGKKASDENAKAEETVTLEERFASIEDILNRMESGEISLDESFELYKKGLSEIKAANSSLDLIEKAMLVLNENGELEEF